MPSFTFNSETFRSSHAIVLLLLALPLYFATLEFMMRTIVPRVSQVERRHNADRQAALKLSQRAPQSLKTVLIVGNSLLQEGIDRDKLRQVSSSQYRVAVFPVENTTYLDWYFGLRRLAIEGSMPDVVVLCLNVRQLVSNSTNGEGFAHSMMWTGDILEVAKTAGLDSTNTSNYFFANLSAWLGGRWYTRSWVLEGWMPSAKTLVDLFTPRGAVTPIQLVTSVQQRIQRLMKLRHRCEMSGARVVFLVLQAVSGVDTVPNVHSAASEAGLAFGTKVQAAPLVWDDASGTNVLAKWSGFWPDGAPTPSSNMQYMTAPILAVNPPHNRVGRYLTGAHEDSANFHTGQDVAVWKNFNKVEGGYLYLSYYSFVNPGWVFTGGMTPQDGNFKTFGYSVQGSIYELPNNWYEAQWDGGGLGLWSQTATNYETIINDDSSQLNGGVFWGHMINPLGGAWVKREILIKTSSTNGGAITITENNGTPSVTYTGITDPYPGTARSAGPGGFARSGNSVLNRRYFADLYMDTTPQRVVLANNVVYAAATITELQIPTSWSDTSIGITVNLGSFSTGQTAYLFVFDSTGTPSASGFPVTVQ